MLQDRRKEPVEENQDQINNFKRSSVKPRGDSIKELQNNEAKQSSEATQNEVYNDNHQTETGLNRTASWVLTDEQKVHSIRHLLREDLWGSSNSNKNNLRGASKRLSVSPTTESVDESAETKSLASTSVDSVKSMTNGFLSESDELSTTKLVVDLEDVDTDTVNNTAF